MSQIDEAVDHSETVANKYVYFMFPYFQIGTIFECHACNAEITSS